MQDNLYENYDFFLFVNSSVIGPFIQKTNFDKKWVDIYIEGLKDNIKLFGSTINTCRDPVNLSHVQSFIFSMDKITLEYLISCEIFSLTNHANTYHEAVYNKEILMSRKILEKGWNIGSLLPCYKNVDFTFSTTNPSDILFLDYPMFPEMRGTLWDEYQLVFIKGNIFNIKPM